jgi:NTP pyrophosphatase (non-canonical NTP hydrolase)
VARVQSDNDRQRVHAHFEESSQRRQGLESLVGHLTVELDEVRRWLDHHVDAAAAYADERATRRSFDDEP